MCELMGMSFAKPVVASVSIKAFSLRSEDNADGWGLAWYPDRALAMVKQPLRWSAQQTQFLDNYPGLLSSIYVAHVRQRTTGSIPTHADTHPFGRELGGRDYCFAHNGTVAGEFWKIPLGRFHPVGQTDSEFLFCLLLEELERFARLAPDLERARHPAGGVEQTNGKVLEPPVAARGHLESEQQWKWLHRFLLHLNDYGRLNCILTDGEQLVVYHDRNGWKNLTYRNVYLHEDSPLHFGDATLAVNLQAELLNHGCIVATNPLSLEGWERFLPGEMKVLHEGNIVFTNRPGLHETPAAAKTAS
jgi:predicted glutamine amidotransferase